MNYGFGTEGYYKKMLELQEKLRKSEEERMKLEEKFIELMQKSRDSDQERLRIIRHTYYKFLEEDKIRQVRNENILHTLDKIENRAKMLAAKTSRFKAFRKQYESYIKRVHLSKQEQQPPVFDSKPVQLNVHRKLFSDTSTSNEKIESKLAVLEQYLKENFDNFPEYYNTKITQGNNNTLFNKENGNLRKENLFYPQKQFGKPENSDQLDSDSKDSQDEHLTNNSKHRRRNKLLGNTIEKALERIKNRNTQKLIKQNSLESKVEHVIQDYKDLVIKSEEKFGLTNDLPVKASKTIPETPDLTINNIPNIFDNVNKTLNTTELQNFVSDHDQKDQENAIEQTEIPLIKIFKNSTKFLSDDVDSPVERNISIGDYKSSYKQESKDDNSDRTEPPTDISLNLSSCALSQGLLPENAHPEEPKITENKEKRTDVSNMKQEQKDEVKIEEKLNVVRNDTENSVEESTIKEQLNEEFMHNDVIAQQVGSTSDQNHSKQVKEQFLLDQEIVQHDEIEQQLFESVPDQNYPEQTQEQSQDNQEIIQNDTIDQQLIESIHDQNYPTQVEEFRKQPEIQEQEEQIYEKQTYQQELDDQQIYDGYSAQNMEKGPEYQKEYDFVEQNAAYPENYDPKQSLAPQSEYPESYNQQNITNQSEYQPEYDVSQQIIPESNYQDYIPQNVDETEYPQTYDDQQQNIPATTYEEGYIDPDQQRPEYQQYYSEQQYQTGEYPDQQQNYDNEQYSEYLEQEYQPQEYDTQQIPVEEQDAENVYRSEQEYLKGEQNIDEQYESEQNQEYQPQDEQQVEFQDGVQESIISESDNEKVISQEFVDSKPIIEKQLPNLADMLDTDTESIKQETKVSNNSDFDFSKS